jgi:ABC-type transport system substrate-binding protein
MVISLGQDDSNEQIFKAIGDSIQAVLGIPYELNPTPDFFANRRERAFTGPFRNNWFPDYPLNENYLAPVYASGNPEEGNTSFGYYNADFEEAIAAGDAAPTLDEAVAEYQNAEAILAADFPTAPLFFSVSSAYYGERLDNVILDPFSGRIKLRPLVVTDAG